MNMKKLYKSLSFTAALLLMLASVALAQERVVTGTVTDENGSGMPGVNVLVKGTSTGTATDVSGKFSLSVPGDDAVLVFTFVGYASQEITVGARTVVDTPLKPDAATLDEIVVVGYGEQKKSLVTGAISTVKAEDLKTVSVGTIDQAIQGRTSGVQIVQNSGQPGAGTRIRIRGAGSSGNSNPLFIIDGIRSAAEGMDFLNTNDIASIEVLKDAASCAIYGANGANGVIIVTTKKGKATAPEINYNGQIGSQTLNPQLKLMNQQQYIDYLEEANVAGRPTTADITDPKGTDWIKEGFSTQPLQNHTLSFSGGTDRSSLYVSGGYFKQNGIAGGDKSLFERYTIRINSSHKLKDWLTFGENFSYTNRHGRGLVDNSEYGGVIGSMLSLDPLTPTHFDGAVPASILTSAGTVGATPLIDPSNGKYYGVSRWITGEFGNPLETYEIAHGDASQNKIFGNVYVDIEPLKYLKITSRLGIDAAFQKYHVWNPTYYYSIERYNNTATGGDQWNQWFDTQWETFATYDRTMGDHHLAVVLGVSTKKDVRDGVGGTYSGLFKQQDKWSYGAFVPDSQDKIGSTNETETLLSYFGRINYDFKNKYLLAVTVRRDGSSLFADGHQWGNFPSASLGWVISNEDFYQGVADVMSSAKLRASWGQNGSTSNVGVGQWRNSISTVGNGPIRYPDETGTYLVGAAPTQAANPFLTWETSEQLNIGADLRFVNERLSLTVDYFKKSTTDLLGRGDPPRIVGIGIPQVNAGTVVNKGWEFELGYKSPAGSAFTYEVTANYTALKNEVTALNEGALAPAGSSVGTHWGNATRFTVGDPIWSFWGYKTDGIFQNQAQIDQYKLDNNLPTYSAVPGDPIVVNTNGDALISPADWVRIGSPQPKYYYGARINLGYKGIDLLVFLQGQGGNDILMGFFRTDRGTANKPAFFYEDRWTEEGSTNSWFRASTTGNAFTSDLMITKGNFTKIRQMQIGYTLPSAINEKLRIKKLRLYVSLDNYFTFTKYKGFDPEVGSSAPNSVGVDRGIYPFARRSVLGCQFTF
jgi:TonB-linked SusC/RagA family outer membrane protein